MYASRFFRRMLIALVLGTVAVPAARATTVIPPDFKTMVSRADVIFRGKVTGVRSEWTGEGANKVIVSYVTFDVIKALKGKPASPYVLKTLGGVVGDDAMQVTGAPKFAVDDKTLLFVEHNGTQFIPLVGIMHGYFRMGTDAKTGDEIVLKSNGVPLQNTAEIDREHVRAVETSGTAVTASTAGAAAMKRSDFEAEIEKWVSVDQ